jgi:hypothetical protein
MRSTGMARELAALRDNMRCVFHSDRINLGNRTSNVTSRAPRGAMLSAKMRAL